MKKPIAVAALAHIAHAAFAADTMTTKYPGAQNALLPNIAANVYKGDIK